MSTERERRDFEEKNEPADDPSPALSPETYQHVLDAAVEAIAIFDRQSLRLIEANVEFCRLVGRSKSDLLKGRFGADSFSDSLDAHQLLESLDRGKGEPIGLAASFRDSSGRTVSVQLTSRLYEEKDRRYLLWTLYGADRQDVPRFSETFPQLLSDFMDDLPFGCQVIDHDWRYVYLNPEACKQGRIEADRAIGHTMMECYPGIEDTVLFSMLKRCVNEHLAIRFENRFTFPDGEERPFELSLFPSSQGVFVLSIDESERRSVEAATSRLAAIVESSDHAIIGKTLDGEITDWNHGAEMLYGYGAPEVIGENISLLLPSDRKRELSDILERIRRGERVKPYDTLRVKKDGSLIDVAVSVSPILDRSGSVVGASATALDVSARKAAERNAQESSRRFETIAEVIDDVFWMADEELLRMAYVSPAFERIWGMSPSELYRDPSRFLEGVHPDDRDRVTRELDVSSRREPFQHDFRVKRPDGSIRNVMQRGYPVFDSNGHVTRWVGIVQDVTERLAAAQRIREQAALLDVTTDIIIVVDNENTVRFWNKSAERTFGLKSEEVERANLLKLMPPNEDSAKLAQISRQVHEKGDWAGEMRAVRKDGVELTLSVRLTQIHDDGGTPTGLMAVATDVTERRAIERQLLRAQRLESLGSLAGGIAHDLNNVLSPILMGVEGLILKSPSPSMRKIIDIIRTSAERGAEIVRQILGFARGVEGEKVEMQLRPILDEIQTITTETFPKTIDIQFSIDRGLWPVVGDSTQIHQVIMNICVNARDAMPDGGRLTLRAHNRELDETYTRMHVDARPICYVVLEISDTGQGMPEGVIEKIFDPFYTTKPLGKGTGLGLSTVLAIVKGHGGFVNVYSEVGSGTVFNVYLPAHMGQKEGAEDDSSEGIPMGNDELIIVVEDEAPIREIARQILESYGYRAVTAEDGTEALVAYLREQGRADVMLIDMMMPNLDGAATIRALRKLNPKLRIIATSGLVSSQQSILAQNLGVNAFLPKPYTAETLLRALYEVLSQDAEG